MSNLNNLSKIIRELDKVNNAHIYVGIPKGNGFLTMIALTQEQGKHIVARNHPYLVIPTQFGAGHKPNEVPGLYKRGNSLGIDDPSQPNGWKIFYVLRQSVDIPPRPFIAFTANHSGQDWANLLQTNIQKIVNRQVTGDEVIRILGDRMKNDLKKTIHQYSRPQNAKLTVNRKGFDNPLTDTGKLENSVIWFKTN